eukprot:327905-Pleurochrysis_carterae.AAC.1
MRLHGCEAAVGGMSWCLSATVTWTVRGQRGQGDRHRVKSCFGLKAASWQAAVNTWAEPDARVKRAVKQARAQICCLVVSTAFTSSMSLRTRHARDGCAPLAHQLWSEAHPLSRPAHSVPISNDVQALSSCPRSKRNLPDTSRRALGVFPLSQ